MSQDLELKVTEQEFAKDFVQHNMLRVHAQWPEIYENIQDFSKYKLGKRFVVKNEAKAVYDLALAVIAQNLHAVVNNLFPRNQGGRIEKLIIKYIASKDCGEFMTRWYSYRYKLDVKYYGDYSVDEVEKYSEALQNNTQNTGTSGDPLSAIPGRLLERWLGEKIHDFEVEVNGKKTGIISPLLLLMIIEIMTTSLN